MQCLEFNNTYLLLREMNTSIFDSSTIPTATADFHPGYLVPYLRFFLSSLVAKNACRAVPEGYTMRHFPKQPKTPRNKFRIQNLEQVLFHTTIIKLQVYSILLGSNSYSICKLNPQEGISTLFKGRAITEPRWFLPFLLH